MKLFYAAGDLPPAGGVGFSGPGNRSHVQHESQHVFYLPSQRWPVGCNVSSERSVTNTSVPIRAAASSPSTGTPLAV